jgi:hypothetical protein
VLPDLAPDLTTAPAPISGAKWSSDDAFVPENAWRVLAALARGEMVLVLAVGGMQAAVLVFSIYAAWAGIALLAAVGALAIAVRGAKATFTALGEGARRPRRLLGPLLALIVTLMVNAGLAVACTGVLGAGNAYAVAAGLIVPLAGGMAAGCGAALAGLATRPLVRDW